MPNIAIPRTPVDNWEQVRDAWVNEVNRFVDEADAWSQRQGWGTLRDSRAITEDRIGSYDVPVLLIHTPKGRLLISPEARFVVGANGLMDLNVYPSFDALVSVVRLEDGWRLKDALTGEVGENWTEDSFRKVTHKLLDAP